MAEERRCAMCGARMGLRRATSGRYWCEDQERCYLRMQQARAAIVRKNPNWRFWV